MMRGSTRARAHVTAREADPSKKESNLASRRSQTNVGGHGQNCAGADTNAVDRRDDRLRTGAHRFDEIAGELRKRQESRFVELCERADDFVNIAAGAKIIACASDDDGFDVGRV